MNIHQDGGLKRKKKTGEVMDLGTIFLPFLVPTAMTKAELSMAETAEEPLLVLSAEASRLSQLSLLERCLVSISPVRSTEYPPES